MFARDEKTGKLIQASPIQEKIEAAGGMETICLGITNIQSIKAIAASIGTSEAAVWDYVYATPAREKEYGRAKEAQAHTLAAQCLAIADDGQSDTYIDANGKERTDNEVVARSRLRVDTRRWLAGKLAPKVFGDKIVQEITGADGGAVRVISTTVSASDASQAYLDMIKTV